MKTKLLKKLRKEARKEVTITKYVIDVFIKNTKFAYVVNHCGNSIDCNSKIYGNWAKGYDKTSFESAQWYANRLVCRKVQCEITKLRIEKNRSMTETIKL